MVQSALAVRRAITAAAFIWSALLGNAPIAGAQTLEAGTPLARSVAREAARLATAYSEQAPQPHADEPWVVRHPVLTGALIGTATGAVLSRTDTVGGFNHDPKVALLGTGIGAWGGLIGSAIHKKRAHERVSAGHKLGIIAGVAGLIAWPALVCYSNDCEW